MPNDTNHNAILDMPPVEDMAVEAINELIVENYASSVMKLGRATLNELGRRLVKPGETVNDAAVEWLEAGGHEVSQRSVYRFAQRFREVYKRVWGGWANKLILARLSADPDFDLSRMQDLIKHRVTTLVAQEVMTSEPSELSTNRLFAHLSLIAGVDKSRLERAKLQLARDQANARAEKLQADIEHMKREQQRKDTQVNERLKAIRSTVNDLEKRIQQGHTIDPALFKSIREELIAMAPPKPAEGGDA